MEKVTKYAAGEMLCAGCKHPLPAVETWPGRIKIYCEREECQLVAKSHPTRRYIGEGEVKCQGRGCDNYRLGQKLSAYKTFFKANQGWMAAATAIADAMGCDERTIRRIIDDFERVSEVPDVVIKALQQSGFDPAARKNAGVISKILRMPDQAVEMNPETAVLSAIQDSKVAKEADFGISNDATALLSPEKQRRLAVRQKIRTALTSVPAEKKLAELVAAIEESMYLEWGQVEPVTITIIPHAPEQSTSGKTTLELAA